MPTEAGRIAEELDRLNVRAPGDRTRLRAAGGSRSGGVARQGRQRARGRDRRGGLASGRGRPDRGAAEGAIRPSGFRDRARRRAAIGTGSGRSIPGADLGHVVRQAVADGLLLKGGGHAMAAGVTLQKDKLAQFRAFLEDRLRDAVTAARREDVLSIDGAVSAAGVTVDLCNLLARGGPYGSGNPEPILALPNHTIAFADPVGENHIRVRFRSPRWRFRQRHFVPHRRQAAGPCADREPRPGGARGRMPRHRSLSGRGAGAIPHH